MHLSELKDKGQGEKKGISGKNMPGMQSAFPAFTLGESMVCCRRLENLPV
jgi:hypothetical protein